MNVVRRVERARRLFEMYGEHLLRDEELSSLLQELSNAIEATRDFMKKIGLTDICRRCALEIGSCCKRWVEDEYDEIILLINLLIGMELPKSRYREDLCFFCGENGCRLKAREVICVNFLCDRAKEGIGFENEIKLQRIEGRELELCFKAREKVRELLSRIEARSSDPSIAPQSPYRDRSPICSHG